MATQSLEQFYSVVLQDAAIQDQLKTAVDQESFTNLVVELAGKNGFSFTSNQVNEMLAGQNVGMRELCDEELELVAGGARASDGSCGDLWTTLFGPC